MLLADEEDALRTLVRELPPNPVIINIGSGFGLSATAMLDERPDAFIFSIEINVSDAEADRLRAAGLEWRRVVRLYGRSQEIGLFWPPDTAHLVYVDGSHLYQDVHDDIRLWLPTVRPRGIIALHDHSPPRPRRETKRQLQHEGWVRRVADELLADHEVVLHVNRLKAFRQRGV